MQAGAKKRGEVDYEFYSDDSDAEEYDDPRVEKVDDLQEANVGFNFEGS